MCGIVGFVGHKNAANKIINGLKRLEYRGYDSAGIALVEKGSGKLCVIKTAGKIADLEHEVQSGYSGSSETGIGHTRWATHGKPTKDNAHPHATEFIALVHNGIIENYADLRKRLASYGISLYSDTDTEVVAQMISFLFSKGASPLEAVQQTISLIQGAYAFGVVFNKHPEMVICARQGSPLAVGTDVDGRLSLGSDAVALSGFASQIIYLESGDIAQLYSNGNLNIFDKENNEVKRQWQPIDKDQAAPDKKGYEHFMLKEIFEQPSTIKNTLTHYIGRAVNKTDNVLETNIHPSGLNWNQINHITIVACGTSYYAGLVAKYWFEKYARIPVEVDVASEYRYRTPPIYEKSIGIFISQSGETADTLAALRYMRSLGHMCAAIVNVPTSTLAREADAVLPTFAGTEVSVASTKAFTAQMTVLAYMLIEALKTRNCIDLSADFAKEILDINELISRALDTMQKLAPLAKKLSKAKDIIYFGRGALYPIAMEGALKMKELSYIHAEGYAAGEMKHGPIALIDKGMPIIVLCPYDKDGLFHKVVSNICEAETRGAQISVLTCNKGRALFKEMGLKYSTYLYPETTQFTAPMLYSIPVQFLAYLTALNRGVDIDQPRNLAKSVTVE
ncbi:MAG: glutamine--fructose-6-phosphate transaminase (isomerizing) [Holosporales bacterium]|jgi:glucosamine--fructose-6-phosphate aminotransferase (isomerizing)|nr:glutamine--fructose-6-phosphate transaminase (isomerizing) [Holosporales bacterium]